MKTDIWMPLYIGDYLADTGHLDAERSGCYLHWLMHYWRKGPLPDDITELVNIGRLRSSDAPSIAKSMLDEFFTKNGDGRWHQKRTDIEMAKWNGKRLKAQEKASKAAEARWSACHAPSIAPSNASSNQQAMLERCPSPSPKYLTPLTPLEGGNYDEHGNIKTHAKKPSKKALKAKKEKPPTKTELEDGRHLDFKIAVFQYWATKNKVECPWLKDEGKALAMFLKACPSLTLMQFKEMLNNRAQSDVVHSARPSSWLRQTTNFANGPLDRFNKPIRRTGNGPVYPDGFFDGGSHGSH